MRFGDYQGTFGRSLAKVRTLSREGSWERAVAIQTEGHFHFRHLRVVNLLSCGEGSFSPFIHLLSRARDDPVSSCRSGLSLTSVHSSARRIQSNRVWLCDSRHWVERHQDLPTEPDLDPS
jgi:hypothetical protein